MVDLRSLEYDELIEFIQELGEPKFRGKQIYKWLMNGVDSFDEMTNISKNTKDKLKEVSYISKLTIREKYVSKIDGTVKYLFSLEDGNCIETVVMRYHHGISVCAHHR